MKGPRFVLVFVGLLTAASTLGVGIYMVAGHYLTGQSQAQVPGLVHCQRTGTQHTVIVKHDQVQPAHTTAHACDQLAIINQDDQLRNIAFGTHDHHQAYDGVTETVLEKGQHVSVILDQVGTFRFHDHFEDVVQGTFTVQPR